jgi:hypothetical protein
MNKKINFWSFILSLICIYLAYLASFSRTVGPFVNSVLGIYPLKIVLCITFITLILGAIGFTGVHDWKSMLRSVATLVITFGLSAFLSFVIFFGSLLS